MANRKFQQFRYALEHDLVELYARFTPDSSDTGIPATLTFGKGITSITKTATGKYQILLEDKYYKFIHLTMTPRSTAYVAAVHPQITDESVNSAKTIDIAFSDGSQFADPGRGEEFHLGIVLRNSSIGG